MKLFIYSRLCQRRSIFIRNYVKDTVVFLYSYIEYYQQKQLQWSGECIITVTSHEPLKSPATRLFGHQFIQW